MSKPRLLDLYCKAGGASTGLAKVGFDVYGCDIERQPNYPFPLFQQDALSIPLDGFEAYWASPPCQGYSWAARRWGKDWTDLIAVTRERLEATGKPFIMENVIGAPLLNWVVLCGESFGLKVIRHRLFEANFLLLVPPHLRHRGKVKDGFYVTVAGHGGEGSGSFQKWQEAIGIDWMTKEEMAQAVPPAYAEFLGRQMIAVVKAGVKI